MMLSDVLDGGEKRVRRMMAVENDCMICAGHDRRLVWGYDTAKRNVQDIRLEEKGCTGCTVQHNIPKC